MALKHKSVHVQPPFGVHHQRHSVFTMSAIWCSRWARIRIYQLAVTNGVTGSYMQIFSDVLTLVILLELSRSLFQYFMEHTIKIQVIIDAGIVFVLRDIMIGLFEHKLKTDDIYALSFLLLVLGIMRIGIDLSFRKNLQSKIQSKAET